MKAILLFLVILLVAIGMSIDINRSDRNDDDQITGAGGAA